MPASSKYLKSIRIFVVLVVLFKSELAAAVDLVRIAFMEHGYAI